MPIKKLLLSCFLLGLTSLSASVTLPVIRDGDFEYRTVSDYSLGLWEVVDAAGLRSAAEIPDAPTILSLSIGGDDGNVIQVVDQNDNPVAGRYTMLVWASAPLGYDPILLTTRTIFAEGDGIRLTDWLLTTGSTERLIANFLTDSSGELVISASGEAGIIAIRVSFKGEVHTFTITIEEESPS